MTERIATGYINGKSIEVAICPYCTGPHVHQAKEVDRETYRLGIHQSGCKRGKYSIVNGDMLFSVKP